MGRKEVVDKWIDLSELSRKGKLINWKASVGCKCKFKYDDIEGEVEIVGYNNGKLIIKYLDYDLFEITTDNLKDCRLGQLIKKITKDFKVEIGQVFKGKHQEIPLALDYGMNWQQNGSKIWLIVGKVRIDTKIK